jgi:hypothetical protein
MKSLERREAMGPKAKQDPESVVKEIKRKTLGYPIRAILKCK